MNSRHSDMQDPLRRALKSVAESTEHAAAPRDLEQRLIHAYRNRSSQAGSIRMPWRRLVLAAAAVLMIAVLGAALWWQSTPEVQRVQPARVETLQMETPQPPADEPLLFAKRPARDSNTVADSRSNANTETEVAVSDFLPLGYSDPAPGAYQVVRVRMERGSLAQYGMPVNLDRSEEALDADLLVGDDGIPRAVRFITPVSDRN